MQRDLVNNLSFEKVVEVDVKTSSDKLAYTNSVDTKDLKSLAFMGACYDITSAPDVLYTPQAYDDVEVTLQESSDNATFTDVDPDEKQLGDTDVSGMYFKVGAVSTERYVRLKVKGENLETLADEKLTLRFAVIAEKYVRKVV